MAREAAVMTRPVQERAALELCPRPLPESGMPAKVAHDLLGIVTIIQGFAELLPTESDKVLQGEYSRRIVRACRRIVAMVDGARAASRLESGVIVLKKERVDLARFLRDCLAAQAVLAGKKGIVLRLELGAAPTPVSIDPGCVERILGNLLENAIKFSPPRSTIRLRASVLGSSLQLAVEDDGQGIPEAELATLFNAYQIGSPRPTGGERSTGLGLSIVKDLVQAHRGVIGLQSEVGRGSIFSIRLPLEEELLLPVPMLARA